MGKGGENSPLIAWIADTLESVALQLVKMQILTEDTIAIETFETRHRDAVVEPRGQIVGPAQFCAWTRVQSSPGRTGVGSKGLQAKIRQCESVGFGPIISPS
jgi:hypothetical protein